MFESIGTIFPADRDHLQLKNHDRLVSMYPNFSVRRFIQKPPVNAHVIGHIGKIVTNHKTVIFVSANNNP